VLASVFADFVDGDDMGMAEGGGGVGFAVEAPAACVAGVAAEQEEFDGDRPVEGDLAVAVDDPHAVVGDFPLKEIVTKRDFGDFDEGGLGRRGLGMGC